MTELRLIGGGAALAEPTQTEVPPVRLPRGRHGIPADVVRANQRQRLLEAAAEALDEQGYGRLTAARVTELAGVSSRTFYQHFEDLWACLLAAYEVEAGHLCSEVETACRGQIEDDAGARTDGNARARARAGIAAALAFLAEEPAVARLLSAEPPPQIAALAAARRELVERLGALLRTALAAAGPTPLPGLERRLVGAALALVSARAAAATPSASAPSSPS